eukprot:6522404-Pyramimonas_sp.AAC.1
MSGAPMESKGLDKVPGDMDSGVAEPFLGRVISAKQARAAMLSLAGSEKQRLHIATMELPDELDLLTLQEKAKAISLPVRKEGCELPPARASPFPAFLCRSDLLALRPSSSMRAHLDDVAHRNRSVRHDACVKHRCGK